MIVNIYPSHVRYNGPRTCAMEAELQKTNTIYTFIIHPPNKKSNRNGKLFTQSDQRKDKANPITQKNAVAHTQPREKNHIFLLFFFSVSYSFSDAPSIIFFASFIISVSFTRAAPSTRLTTKYASSKRPLSVFFRYIIFS